MTQQSHSWTYTQRKTIIRKDICMPMFITALFTIAKTWKQPKCLSTEECERITGKKARGPKAAGGNKLQVACIFFSLLC